SASAPSCTSWASWPVRKEKLLVGSIVLSHTCGSAASAHFRISQRATEGPRSPIEPGGKPRTANLHWPRQKKVHALVRRAPNRLSDCPCTPSSDVHRMVSQIVRARPRPTRTVWSLRLSVHALVRRAPYRRCSGLYV